MELRPYQKEAKTAVLSQWEQGNSKTLLVLPTGCGKTIVFAKIAEDRVRNGERVLILAHRGELLEQAADKILNACGLGCAVEKAEESCTGEKQMNGINEWYMNIQNIVDDIDRCIKSGEDERLTLGRLSQTLGYSEYYVSRKFSKISGMKLRDYMRYRRLAFALRELRDTDKGILDIAIDYGFTSHEAFTRAFKAAYGITPSAYRLHPVPVILRTAIRPFDCYLLGIGGTGMAQTNSDIKAYFVTIPAHKFLHIRNFESIGYYDFREKQSHIPGQDCATICGLLDSIKGKLDDMGGDEANSGGCHRVCWLGY